MRKNCHIGTGGQTDDDLDGIGNVCDADFDGSRFMNVTDLLRVISAELFGTSTLSQGCATDDLGFLHCPLP